jgi:hypothetical protein
MIISKIRIFRVNKVVVYIMNRVEHKIVTHFVEKINIII